MDEIARLTALIMAARIGLVVSGLVLLVVAARVVWDQMLG